MPLKRLISSVLSSKTAQKSEYEKNRVALLLLLGNPHCV